MISALSLSEISVSTLVALETSDAKSLVNFSSELVALLSSVNIESDKAFLDPYYISGQFVKYKKVGDKLYVNRGLGKVIVLYHRELLDEDGLPEINDKEAIAIAEYIAYVQKYKEAIKTNNKYVLQQAQDLRQ